MPNYVKNILTIESPSAAEKEAATPVILKCEDFDFNNFIPMPEGVSDADSLKWCVENWGTKWNAVEPYAGDWETGIRIEFDTAYSEPSPIYEAMSRLFPEATFAVDFASEDIGSVCAQRVYQNGKIVEGPEGYIEDFEEAVRLACDLWNCDPDEFLSEDEDKDNEDDDFDEE